jgi:hypothetical protein
MNKKGNALIIAGIPVGVIILIIFEIWTWNQIATALEPEMEKAISQLDDKIVCPPELGKEGYELCLDAKGNVLINGIIKNQLSLSTDLSENCNIKEGRYNYDIVCKFDKLGNTKTITLNDKGIKFAIGSEKILYYSSTLGALRKPLSNGLKFWKAVKYIPV